MTRVRAVVSTTLFAVALGACTGNEGPPGAKGDPGVNLVWRGPWSSSTPYTVNDAVGYAGSAYVAASSSTNSPPPSPAWDVLVARGVTGEQGPQGLQGPVGPAGGVNVYDGDGLLLGPLVSPGNTNLTDLTTTYSWLKDGVVWSASANTGVLSLYPADLYWQAAGCTGTPLLRLGPAPQVALVNVGNVYVRAPGAPSYITAASFRNSTSATCYEGGGAATMVPVNLVGPVPANPAPPLLLQ